MMVRKLRSKAGETLAEVLVALLIVALATMLLASMVSAAAGIDKAARDRDIQYAQDLTKAETRTGDGTEKTGYVEIKDVGSNQRVVDFDVTLYGGSGLTSYAKKEAGTP